MTLALTPQLLEAAYTYFLVTYPFRSWKLPPASEIKFAVTGHLDRRGDCWDTSTVSRLLPSIGIRISRHYIGHTHSLMEVMAHEMIHVRQYIHRLGTVNAKHNTAFRKDALAVCRHHGFDHKAFM